MASSLDRATGGNNLTNWLLQAIFCLTATTTYTPGTGGPAAKTVTPPFKLRLLTTNGSNTANGTEATAGNNPGYTAGGISMGSPAFANPSAGTIASSNAVSYTASGTQTANITGIEVWDSAATALRYAQGSITAISGVVSGDTVQFPASTGVTYDASQW